MNTNITKRIHINPQSKGSLGKSFEAEFRPAWLDLHGILIANHAQWRAAASIPRAIADSQKWLDQHYVWHQ
jgi:hypothetical protein